LSNQKLHKKATENLLFLKERVASMPQSAAYALIQYLTELRERMAKKEAKFSEFITFFDAKNDRKKKKKTNNQTYLIASERSVTF